jgi:hypothetical protein
MMRVISAAVCAAALVAGAAAPLPALAKAYPKVAGMSCSAAASKVGAGNVWRTSFAGAQDTQSKFFRYRWYRAAPCFTSQGNCKAWLYNTQTTYPLFMDFVPCHRGKR